MAPTRAPLCDESTLARCLAPSSPNPPSRRRHARRGRGRERRVVHVLIATRRLQSSTCWLVLAYYLLSPLCYGDRSQGSSPSRAPAVTAWASMDKEPLLRFLRHDTPTRDDGSTALV